MGACIFKQPNGLYGRYSYTCDDFTAMNMTEEEYKVLCLDNSLRNSEDTLKHHLQDYNYVINDAKEYVEQFKDTKGLDEEDIEFYNEEYARYYPRLKEYMEEMETPYNNKIKEDYYKTVLGVVERLSSFYTEDWKKKDYLITSHPLDMEEITKKLQEVIDLFDDFEKKHLDYKKNKKLKK